MNSIKYVQTQHHQCSIAR